MDRIDKEKIKEFFQNKRNLKIMIGATSALIVLLIIWFFWAIYTQDKPEFIPKETRGDIREGIKEGIAKPIEKVIPSIGKQIVDAAYQPKEADQSGTQTNSTNDTSTWQTYKNETYGYEVKYPEDYLVKENNTIANIYKKEYGTFQGEFPLVTLRAYPITVSNIDLNNWIDTNKNVFIGDQESTKVSGFNNRKYFSFSGNTGIYFDIETMGLTRYYIFQRDNKIIVFEVITLGNTDLLVTSESMITNFK